MKENLANGEEILWKDRQRLLLFALPFTFTKYTLTNKKLKVDKGLLTVNHDICQLYRILDASVSESLFQRIFGLGNIELQTSDKSLGNFTMKNIKHPVEVCDTILHNVENIRSQKKVSTREFIGGDSDDLDTDTELE